MMRIPKSKGRRGAELLEFTFCLIPLLMMMFLLLDAAWGIFVKSTLAYACRSAVRVGITITGTQARAVAGGGADLTTIVKSVVQRNALGLLGSNPTDTRMASVKVHYFLPPAPGAPATAVSVDVSNLSNGNNPLNVMQVSVEGFPVAALVPRLFGLRTAVDKSASNLSAVAADLIEPSRDPPVKGTAP